MPWLTGGAKLIRADYWHSANLAETQARDG
jgi:hypothetical protein